MLNPWRALRYLPELDLRWRVGGARGDTEWNGDRATITLDRTLGQAARRSALVHELMHVLRGRPPIGEAARRKEEAAVSLAAARLLIPLDRLIDVLLWTTNHHEAADELWVDHFTFVTRINHLQEHEWQAIELAMDGIEQTA